MDLKKERKKRNPNSLLISIGTVLVSSLLSWLISNGSVKRAAVSDLQRELLQKESAVLNKISDISSESGMSCLVMINTRKTTEIHITTYMNPDNTVASQDTTYFDYPTIDTVYYYMPRFVYKKDSYEKVMNCLQYVEAHVDELNLNTYNQVNNLLMFVRNHPIVLIDTETDFSNNEWIKPEIYTEFRDKVDKINQSYLKRLEKFGL